MFGESSEPCPEFFHAHGVVTDAWFAGPFLGILNRGCSAEVDIL